MLGKQAVLQGLGKADDLVYPEDFSYHNVRIGLKFSLTAFRPLSRMHSTIIMILHVVERSLSNHQPLFRKMNLPLVKTLYAMLKSN
jgi:hypothetical protein